MKTNVAEHSPQSSLMHSPPQVRTEIVFRRLIVIESDALANVRFGWRQLVSATL